MAPCAGPLNVAMAARAEEAVTPRRVNRERRRSPCPRQAAPHGADRPAQPVGGASWVSSSR